MKRCFSKGGQERKEKRGGQTAVVDRYQRAEENQNVKAENARNQGSRSN